jgi:galactoside O-acetyltransferase
MIVKLLNKINGKIIQYSNMCRILYFKLLGCDIGKNVYLGKAVKIYYKPELVKICDNTSIEEGVKLMVSNLSEENAIYIGSNSFIGRYSTIATKEYIYIGDNVLIAPFCYISGGNHGMQLGMPMREQAMVYQSITLEDDVWLGNGVTVLPGVTIGRGAVVGAGSVVTKNIPPNAIVGGIPAKLIKFRKSENIY